MLLRRRAKTFLERMIEHRRLGSMGYSLMSIFDTRRDENMMAMLFGD